MYLIIKKNNNNNEKSQSDLEWGCDATNSPLVTMEHPTFVLSQITPSRGPIPKPNYLPHRWTYLTYHPNRIHIQSAILPQCSGQTDRQTNRWLEGMLDEYRALLLYRERQRGLIKIIILSHLFSISFPDIIYSTNLFLTVSGFETLNVS